MWIIPTLDEIEDRERGVALSHQPRDAFVARTNAGIVKIVDKPRAAVRRPRAIEIYLERIANRSVS